MRFNSEEVDDLLESVNCKMDWLKLMNFVLSEPQFFTTSDRLAILNWLTQTEDLYLKF